MLETGQCKASPLRVAGPCPDFAATVFPRAMARSLGVNELCEEVFGKRAEILKPGQRCESGWFGGSDGFDLEVLACSTPSFGL